MSHCSSHVVLHVVQETERELIPVQRAVKKLAQSGKALESGDLKAVSDALGYDVLLLLFATRGVMHTIPLHTLHCTSPPLPLTSRGSWVTDLEAAGKGLSATDAARAKLSPVIKSIAELKGAADTGNLKAAKGSFVATVDALSTWVVAAGIDASIKGI